MPTTNVTDMRLDNNSFGILRFLGFRKPLTEYPGFFKKKMGFANYESDPMEEGLAALKYFIFHWDEVSDAFSYRVELLSKNYCFEEIQARFTLAEHLESRRAEILGNAELQGTVIVPHLRMSLSYYIPFDADGMVDYNNLCLLQLSEYNALSLAVFPDEQTGHRTAFVSCEMKSVDYEGVEVKTDGDIGKSLDYLDVMVSTLINHHLFKRFANVKTKIVAREGTREAKKINPEKDYVSSLPYPVRQLDATYFTTTIRTGAFLRRGHFRMQRYKNDGEWDHKLIWIDQTTVSGYTRKARVLVNPDTDD